MKKGILQRISDSAVWRSIFRTGMPDTDLKRSLLIYNNFFLHIFPAKIKRHGLGSPVSSSSFLRSLAYS
jgi:hypothetical protein